MAFIIAAIAAAAAAGIGAGGSAAAKVGQNNTTTNSFGQTGQYNPDKFNYGGTPGGADSAANRYQWQGEHAGDRGAAQADYGRAGQWDQTAGQMGQMGLYARGGQQNVADMMNARAMGLVPSIAQQQGDRQMQQAAAAQGSLAASARGPAALALAQQQGANNTANAQGSIAGQTQINAGNERLQAEQAASNAYTGLRTGDISQQQAALQAQQQAAQMAQYQAMLNQQQHGLNDTYSLGMANNERGVWDSQLAAGGGEQRMLEDSQNLNQKLVQDQSKANADRQFDYVKMAIGGGAASSMMGAGGGGGGARAAGGPVKKGGLYLVGEHGPELMVAPSDGHIIPNHALMAGAAQAAGRNGLSGMGAQDMQKILDDQYVQNTAGTVGQEVLRKPFAMDASAPWAGDVTDPSKGLGGYGVRYAASPQDQASFEHGLIAGPPSKLDQSNAAEAAKIQQSFAQDAALKQYQQQFGTDASAGARGDANGQQQMSVGKQILMGLLGGRRAA